MTKATLLVFPCSILREVNMILSEILGSFKRD